MSKGPESSSCGHVPYFSHSNEREQQNNNAQKWTASKREQNTNQQNVFTLSFETRFMQNHSVNMPNAYLYIWYVLSQKYVVLIPISDRIAKLCSETWARKIESLSSYEFRRGLTCFTINETPYWLAISIPYLQLCCWLVGPLKKERNRFA